MTTVADLLNAMNEAGIRYVHWKSNRNIEEALSGREDLDLLVHPEDRKNLEQVFADTRVLRAFSKKDGWQPHIFHYLGMDGVGRALVHAHVHYALTVGFDYCKNYILPISPAYLQSAIRYKNVYLPEPEKEFYVLVLRLLLKSSLIPFLIANPRVQFDVLKKGSRSTIGGSAYKEYEELKGRIDRTRLRFLVETEFALIPPGLFAQCESVIEEGASVGHLLKVAWSLERALEKYAIRSRISFGVLSFFRLNGDRLSRAFGKLTRATRGKRLAEGRMIAFIGGDGAGKSTNVAALAKTMSRHLAVNTFHIGRPRRSLSGIVVKAGKRICQVLGFPSVATALSHVALAVDRTAEFRRADRLRRSGGIAILDRMPLTCIRSMDAPRIPKMEGRRGRIVTYLEKVEARLYGSLGSPDRFIVLKVDPEIAARRRKEDDQSALRARSGEIWRAEWSSPSFRVFDTGVLDRDEVAREVCRAAWEASAQPPLRIELIGLPCSGKSTLARAAMAATPNARKSLPYKRALGFLILRFPLLFSAYIRAYWKSGNAQVAKNYTQLLHTFALLSRWEEQGSMLGDLVLDQSILFQLAMCKREGLLEQIEQEQVRLIRSFVQHAFYLTAEQDVLFSRLKTREQSNGGRVYARTTRSEFDEFCRRYEAAFEWVFSIVNVPITVLHTSDADVNTLIGAIKDSAERGQ